MADFMLDSSGSEDEFPAVADIIRRHKSKQPATTTITTTTKIPIIDLEDKENIPTSKPQLKSSSMTPRKVEATPLRRRKLGLAQTQAVDGSLFQPWTGKKGEPESAFKGRETSRLKPKSSRGLLRRGSIESFASSSMDTSRDSRTKNRPRLEVDSDEDDDNPFVRQRTKSVRPLRFRELISRAPSSGDEDEDSPNSQLQREALSAVDKSVSIRDDSITRSIGEESSFNNSSGDSALDSFRTDSELFATPPKRRAKTPGRRRLDLVMTAATVKPTEKKAIRTVSRTTSVALKDAPSGNHLGDQPLGKTPGKASKGSLATKGGSLEDAFQKLKIFNDFSDSDSDKSGEKTTAMDPSTPTKKSTTIPPSPHKTPRIPLSPWKPENQEFWDPEVNFAWIDKHSSPAKQAPKLDLGTTTTNNNNNNNNNKSSPVKKKSTTATMPVTDRPISPTKKQQREAKKAFDATKDALALAFLAELDARVTEGRLTALTAAAGGLRTVWSNALQTTAGRAHWKCRTVTHADGTGGGGTVREAQHEAHIELASKVLTNEADLLNTVAHEFCHLAVFMLHHNPNDKNAKRPAAHGTEFKAWGRRCSAAFAHRGIEVTTRHSYDIDYKFAWRCGECATEVQRHSRSVDPRRHRCGRCKGLLVQIRPVPRGAALTSTLAEVDKNSRSSHGHSGSETAAGGGGGGGGKMGMAKRQPSAWQDFLGKEMKELSSSQKGLSFEKKMEIVSAKWKVVRDDAKPTKTNKTGGGKDASSTTTTTINNSSSKDITEGVKALEIEDATATAAAGDDDEVAITATADGEEEDDIVIISASG